MNIDEYRALKAAQKAEEEKPKETPKPTPTPEPTPNPTPEPTPTPDPTPKEASLPDKVFVEGFGEITIAELKNGYMRGRDYTQKTQDLSRKKQELSEAERLLQAVQSNPELAEVVKSKVNLAPNIDPATRETKKLEEMVLDLKLEIELERLKGKYGEDFDEVEVLTFANTKRIRDLDDAYKLLRSSKGDSVKDNVVDIEDIRKKIRAEVQAELEKENATTSIITSNSGLDKKDDTPVVTKQEEKIALRMFRDCKDPVGEYIKWRGVEKKPSPK